MSQSQSLSKKPLFSDGKSTSLTIPSTWSRKDNSTLKDFSTQTDENLYEFNEIETQTGMGTVLIQDVVSSKKEGLSLIEYLVNMTKKKYKINELRNYIDQGYVHIDDEVCKNSELRVEKDAFVELLLVSHEVSTQTIPSEMTEMKINTNMSNKIDHFLQSKLRVIENELQLNIRSKAFDNYTFTSIDSNSSNNSGGEDIRYWKTLTVDLEKRKVTYPDWSTAKHSRGKIGRVTITRTKERVYDVDYDDGSRLKSIREEHIRVIEDTRLVSDRKTKGKISNNRFLEGVRVHTRVQYKNGDVKYLPGRIIRAPKGSGGYDVEIEGGRTINGVTTEDMMIGIEEGQSIEALKPNKVELQAMNLCWNSTGSSIATSYGRHDIVGWCNYPGAVVIWNIFSASGSNKSNGMEPEYVLDHSTCLMTCKFHPEYPSILAAGSFNGEIVVWDLNTPEQPVCVSPITEYTHKEPITDLSWLYDATNRMWLLVSVGADGRILFWDYMGTNLAYPVRGSLLSTTKSMGNTASGRSMRQYPLTYGATAIAFTSSSIGSMSITTSATTKVSNKTISTSTNQWTVVGQEGGTILRTPTNRFFEPIVNQSNAVYLTKDSFKSLPSYEDLFQSMKRVGDTFHHESHIGTIHSLDCSPLYRNIFLSGGADGSIKLFHMLERVPLKQWDPMPSPGTSGTSGTFSPITDVKFSPIRACVFAASSADGFLYLYDLSASLISPVAILEAIAPNTNTISSIDVSDPDTLSKQTKPAKSMANHGNRRVGITSIAFNHKQRDLIAASDIFGKIHIWRLSWKLANKQDHDTKPIDSIARIQSDS